jgi:hypothetical protein
MNRRILYGGTLLFLFVMLVFAAVELNQRSQANRAVVDWAVEALRSTSEP